MCLTRLLPQGKEDMSLNLTKTLFFIISNWCCVLIFTDATCDKKELLKIFKMKKKYCSKLKKKIYFRHRLIKLIIMTVKWFLSTDGMINPIYQPLRSGRI